MKLNETQSSPNSDIFNKKCTVTIDCDRNIRLIQLGYEMKFAFVKS